MNLAILNPKYDFLKADYANPNLTKKPVKIEQDKKSSKSFKPFITAAGPIVLLSVPELAFAADSSFDNIYPSLMRMFDSAVVLVIVFAGASWALGHRSKAIELLIGVCCGYLLARNAVNIRDYLKSL